MASSSAQEAAERLAAGSSRRANRDALIASLSPPGSRLCLRPQGVDAEQEIARIRDVDEEGPLFA